MELVPYDMLTWDVHVHWMRLGDLGFRHVCANWHQKQRDTGQSTYWNKGYNKEAVQRRMREQKELPSFPKECGHQTHNPTWQKNPSLPYSIPGNRLLGFSCWY